MSYPDAILPVQRRSEVDTERRISARRSPCSSLTGLHWNLVGHHQGQHHAQGEPAETNLCIATWSKCLSNFVTGKSPG